MLEDLDPAETREWLEVLDSVLAYEGADRGRAPPPPGDRQPSGAGRWRPWRGRPARRPGRDGVVKSPPAGCVSCGREPEDMLDAFFLVTLVALLEDGQRDSTCLGWVCPECQARPLNALLDAYEQARFTGEAQDDK